MEKLVGLKTRAKEMEPQWVQRRRVQASVRRLRRRNRDRPIEDVFTDIYLSGAWGKGTEGFSSGEGTRDSRLVDGYVGWVEHLAATDGFAGGRFVDLGCGDFVVGRRLLPLAGAYIGVDIAKPVIDRNIIEFGSESVSFLHANLVVDELPEGDVCFVRQVMQHLSNDEILALLPKLGRFRWVVITEHIPVGRFNPNVDKPHGSDTRVSDGSGVLITASPFSIPAHKVRLLGSMPVSDDEAVGQLSTWLYEPGRVGISA